MSKSKLATAMILAACMLGARLGAQVPVELFFGHKKAIFDQAFFRFFKQKDGQNSKVMFFSRQRASFDYQQTGTAYQPTFSLTEGVSWSPSQLKGVGPIFIGQLINRTTYAKPGLQYGNFLKKLILFGWAVTELNKDPDLELFIFIRYTPTLTDKLQLFTQVEFINTFPTTTSNPYSLIQRLRVGLKRNQWQAGAAADFSQSGRDADFTHADNLGCFLRHEF
jgi:hypothetical protein